MARTKKIQTRKLEESSWLAQTIKDRMDIESETMGTFASTYWNCLHTLLIIVREADNKDNRSINYIDNGGIIISNIPSLTLRYGTDFDKEGMQNRLRALQYRYTDFDGNYIVSVLTTNDLNSAEIKNVSDLLFEMSQIK